MNSHNTPRYHAESDFNRGLGKTLLAAVIVLAVFGMCITSMMGADITPGYTFTSGEQNVTHTKLNLLGSGTINNTFFSGKSATTAPTTAYYLMLYDSGADTLYKCTLDNAFFVNSALISGRSANTAPDTNASTLIYTPSSGLYTKSTLDKAYFSHDFLINGRQTDATPAPGATLLTYDGGIYQKVLRTNLFGGILPTLIGTNGFTNLTAKTSLTNQDALMIFDSVNGVNKYVTPTNLLVGAYQTSTNATNGDYIAVYNATTNVMVKVPLSAIKYYVTNAGSVFATTNNFPFGSGGSNTVAHTLGGTPSNVRCTLLCVADDSATGFKAGDEIDLPGIIDSSTVSPVIMTYANATNVYIMHQSGGTGTRIMIRGSGTYSANITTTNNFVWKVRAWQ